MWTVSKGYLPVTNPRSQEEVIQQLQKEGSGHSQKLWEVNNLREWALQDKEDEHAISLCELRKEHEKRLIKKEDSYLKELREFKKKSEQTLCQVEDLYIMQLAMPIRKHRLRLRGRIRY